MPLQNVNSLLNANTLIDERYELIRSGVFHYLQVTDDEKDIFSSSSKLESKPNIVFYTENSDTKAIIDFSGCSGKDKKYISILFSGLNDFSGISLTNAVYLDERNGITDKSLTCSLLYREFKNDILFAKVLNSIDSGDLNKVFYGSYLIDIPVITTDSSWSNKTSKTYSSIINLNTNSAPNFDMFNILQGDLIEIVNPDSSNNQQRFEILDVYTLNNKQIIKCKDALKSEFLVGKNTVLNFYTKSKAVNIEKTTLDKTTLGCCTDLINNINYKNTTQYECYVRFNRSSKYSFTFDSQCITNATTQSNIINNTGFTTPYETFDVDTFTVAGVGVNEIVNILKNGKSTDKSIKLIENVVYLFRQTSSFDSKKILRFSTSNENFVPYLNDIFGNITKTGNGSAHYTQFKSGTPNLYLFLQDIDTGETVWTNYEVVITSLQNVSLDE